jgi:ribonuclease BN (tRNA processing enzyme)
MKIIMLGTGTSYPDPERVQSGILVEHRKERILLDIGSGVLHRLVQSGINLDTIGSIFISHFHIDHCSDFLSLCQSIWLSDSKTSLNVYGPPFIGEWLQSLHERAFPYLREKVTIQVHQLEKNKAVQIDEMMVVNTPTIHGTVDSRAFRVEAGGKSLVFSSDTSPSREFNDFSKGTDVLIHECNWLDGQHPQGVHTSPSELAQIVKETSPGRVVLTHLSPEVVRKREMVLKIVASQHDVDAYLGEDLMALQI